MVPTLARSRFAFSESDGIPSLMMGIPLFFEGSLDG
jgi:hypothetical protein